MKNNPPHNYYPLAFNDDEVLLFDADSYAKNGSLKGMLVGLSDVRQVRHISMFLSHVPGMFFVKHPLAQFFNVDLYASEGIPAELFTEDLPEIRLERVSKFLKNFLNKIGVSVDGEPFEFRRPIEDSRVDSEIESL